MNPASKCQPGDETGPTANKPTAGDEEAAEREAQILREAARIKGRRRSERKTAAAKANGKKGGRPPGSTNSPSVRAEMKAAQQRRRSEEKARATCVPASSITDE